MAWNCIETGLFDQSELLQYADKLISGNMTSRHLASHGLLRHDPKNRKMLKRVLDCKSQGGQYYCEKHRCPYCSNPNNRKYLRRLYGHSILTEGKVNYLGPRYSPPKSRSKTARNSQTMVRPFAYLSNDEVAPTTINLGIIPGGVDYREQFEAIRNEAKQTLARSPLHNAIIFLRAEYPMAMARELEPYLLSPSSSATLIEVPRNDQLVAFVHVHGLIHWPGHSPDEVRIELKKLFPGNRQVCVRKVLPDEERDGYVTLGAQGFAEYACKDMISIVKPKPLPELTDEENDERCRKTIITSVFAEEEFRRELTRKNGFHALIKLNIPQYKKNISDSVRKKKLSGAGHQAGDQKDNVGSVEQDKPDAQAVAEPHVGGTENSAAAHEDVIGEYVTSDVDCSTSSLLHNMQSAPAIDMAFFHDAVVIPIQSLSVISYGPPTHLSPPLTGRYICNWSAQVDDISPCFTDLRGVAYTKRIYSDQMEEIP